MLEPLCDYYMAVLADFAALYSDVLVDEGLSKQEILKLIFRLGAKTGWDHRFNSNKRLKK